ncbi:MAG: hypothetical protein QOD67_4928 [Caballeronia sp.]|nr:hypothetical protein [Caballeronia sp.]
MPEVVSAHRIISNTANAMQCSVVTLNDDPAISLVDPLAARDETLDGGIEVRPFTIKLQAKSPYSFRPTKLRAVS